MAAPSHFTEFPKILIFDFGSQYSHLIVRRCREVGVFSELVRGDCTLEVIQKFVNVRGIILSGGPSSVYESGAPHTAGGFWDFCFGKKIPVLGICYGMQEMMHSLGGAVQPSSHREFGHANLSIIENPVPHESSGRTANIHDPLWRDLDTAKPRVWMSHGDKVTSLAPGFRTIGVSENSEFAAVSDPERLLWGLQFHPEVTHSDNGFQILWNFIRNICGVAQSWDMKKFVSLELQDIIQKVGPTGHVIGALSGGVDSTVAAALVSAAIGDRFHGFMVDTGLLRKDEAKEVADRLKRAIPSLQLEVIDASETFFNALAGVKDPERKRKIIGGLFIDTFVAATTTLGQKLKLDLKDAFLLQGTLYPDVIESVSFKGGPSQTIKTHHNVGGLPEKMQMRLLEPLRELFKDEVRSVGKELGLDISTVWRHPFPGPGLGIRIVGEVTRERAETLRAADAIFMEEIRRSGDYEKIGQALAVLLPDAKSVGVMGDQRTYEWTVVLRAIETSDFMTGDWYPMPYDVLKRCSSRIINEVQKVNRVCYDISSKPPATIEWE